MSPRTQRAGPPPKESGPKISRQQATDPGQPNPAADVPAALRRRRAASWRCPPLADGRRDPLDPVPEPLTDAELDSWRVAWWHTRRSGFELVVPERVRLAAGSRGGDPS